MYVCGMFMCYRLLGDASYKKQLELFAAHRDLAPTGMLLAALLQCYKRCVKCDL